MSLNFKNKKVLVTGADGFIGSHLCSKLVQLGAKVKALSLYNAYNKIGWLEDLDQNILKEIEICSGDVRDSALVENITKKIDVVFHLAALISIPYSYNAPNSFLQTNTFGTMNILDAIKKNKCERLISTSTSEVYGTAIKVPIDENHRIQAQSPYAASKISADYFIESYVRTYGVPALILRPFNTYGPRQSEKAVISSIFQQVLDDTVTEIKVGNLDTKRDFNYVEDTVMAFVSLALADKNKVQFGIAYNAGSGHAEKIGSVLKKIISISNSKKRVIIENKRFRPVNSEVENLLACSKKLNKLTKWLPKTSLEEGLKKTLNWWIDRKEKGIIKTFRSYSI